MLYSLTVVGDDEAAQKPAPAHWARWRPGNGTAVTVELECGAPHNMDYSPTRWPESPWIAMRCTL